MASDGVSYKGFTKWYPQLITNYKIEPVIGSNNQYACRWGYKTYSLHSTADHVEISWQYWVKTPSGLVVIDASSTNADPYTISSTYSPPAEAVSILCQVRLVSKTDEYKYTVYESTNTKNKKNAVEKTVHRLYWITPGYGASYTIDKDAVKLPAKPSTPTVSTSNYDLIAELNSYDENTRYLEFQIVKNDQSVVKTVKSRVVTNHAAIRCPVASGAKYKVRARGIFDPADSKTYGEWSEYSNNVETIPKNPTRITKHKVLSANSVQIYWDAVTNATSYDIEYAVNKSYFDTSSNVQSVTTDSGVTSRIIDQLDSGQTWFFRVRAANSTGKSGWSAIYSILLGKIPAAPTTWSDTTSIIVGRTVDLYWMHNSEDGSSQTAAQIQITVNGSTTTITRSGSQISTEPEVASYYTYDVRGNVSDEILDSSGVNVLDSSGAKILSNKVTEYSEGTVIQWRVRTKGVLTSPNSGYSEWSTTRTIIAYAPPTLDLSVSRTANHASYAMTFTAFPIYIRAEAGPTTQNAVGWSVSIVSNQNYITDDPVGDVKRVTAGSEVFSRYYPATSNTLNLALTAGDLDLESDISYTLKVVVAMDSSLSAESETSFMMLWDTKDYIPNAEVAVDNEAYSAYITPFCLDTEGNLVSNISLSVYRREYDGRYVLIQDNISNDRATTITDPHPALDYARYRIVSTDKNTGEVGYYDSPDVPIGETGIIIQWDEDWKAFARTGDTLVQRVEEPWSGSLVKLPYNITVSDSYSMDVNLAEYIGRSHPVSYYGTQLGVSGSWTSDIPRDDTETLYSLRRLAIYAGDAYVREPSGVGYWAKVNVSFNKSYNSMTIPVTIDVTRVEGGV